MISTRQTNFKETFEALSMTMLAQGKPVHTERWQGEDIQDRPEARTHELRNVVLDLPLKTEDLDHWREDIGPNLPWADDHFLERVGGEPLNPGVQWKKWPWANSADRFRTAGGEDPEFNHTYMERLWPKWARLLKGGMLNGKGREYRGQDDPGPRMYPRGTDHPIFGIRAPYGDLWDLVQLLVREPLTRQAWIPLYFPEDTGLAGRKPCTLGYQFMVRDGRCHIYYPLRSCDLVRHFRDDCYLAVRLLLWIIQECRGLNPDVWEKIVPGDYTMHMTSLHVFENDRRAL